jgi:myo-inositol-1(or 4)-monophosphatase
VPVDLDTRPLEMAAQRAIDVGARLLRHGRARVQRIHGKGDRDFATDVDLAIEREMRTTLHEAAPDVGFLGEEEGGTDGDGPSWVLDPIDGTINFARGSPLCATSLALVIDGQPVLGIVDAPLLGERFHARAGHGAWRNGHRMRVSDPRVLHEAIVGLSDFKVGRGAAEENTIHLALITELATRCLRVRMHGSAALDLAWLADGRLNATAMLSNLPWDVTAGLLLVREAGGCVFDLDGADHDTRSRFTLAAVPSLKGDLCDLVQAASRRRPRP